MKAVPAASPAPAVAAPVLVTAIPPGVPSNLIVARPSPDYIWIEGAWTTDDGKYVWNAGHWELPPGPDALPFSPWVQQGNAYRFRDGFAR